MSLQATSCLLPASLYRNTSKDLSCCAMLPSAAICLLLGVILLQLPAELLGLETCISLWVLSAAWKWKCLWQPGKLFGAGALTQLLPLQWPRAERGTNRTPTYSLIPKHQWPKKEVGSTKSKCSVGTNSFIAGRETGNVFVHVFLTVFLLFSSSTPTDISNPSYLGMAAFSQQPSATSQLKQIPSPDQQPALWSYEQQPKETTSVMGQSQSSSTSPSVSPLSPKPSLQPTVNRSICSRSQEYL